MLEEARSSTVTQDNGDSTTGLLRVEVFTGTYGAPIEGAHVTVTKNADGGSTLLRMMETDRSGSTETIELEAPPASISEQPGSIGKPFSEYNIRIEYPGYFIIENINVPIFSGQTALQRVSMIPLPQGESANRIIRYVETEPNL